ncbi:MAG: TAXI family TRAP transporter solute-binding subunit [Variovorax sp.]
MNFSRMVISAALVATAASTAMAGFDDKEPITATVTGATVSGYPRTMVEGLDAIVRDAYPGSAISFKPNSPGGGVLAIAEGKADFTATASGTEIRLANEGQAPFQSSLKGKFMFGFKLHEQQYIHFIMTKAWSEKNGIKSWSDIAAKKPRMRLAINRSDNPQTTIGAPYQVMKVHGFSIDDIEKWGGSFVLGNSTIGMDALLDDKADVFINARNLGDATLKDVASKRDLLWIDDDIKKTEEAAEFFNNKAVMVPKGTYAFMDKDYPTIRQYAAMLVSSQTPDDVVYKYVKAIAENADRVQKIGGAVKDFTAKDMANNPSPLPIHPGALRYFKEKGWVK